MGMEGPLDVSRLELAARVVRSTTVVAFNPYLPNQLLHGYVTWSVHGGFVHRHSPPYRCDWYTAIASGWRTRRAATKPTCICGTGTLSPCSRYVESQCRRALTHPAHSHSTALRPIMHSRLFRHRRRATRRLLLVSSRGRRRRRAPPLSPSTGLRTATGRPLTARRGSPPTRLLLASVATSCASLTRAVGLVPIRTVLPVSRLTRSTRSVRLLFHCQLRAIAKRPAWPRARC